MMKNEKLKHVIFLFLHYPFRLILLLIISISAYAQETDLSADCINLHKPVELTFFSECSIYMPYRETTSAKYFVDKKVSSNGDKMVERQGYFQGRVSENSNGTDIFNDYDRVNEGQEFQKTVIKGTVTDEYGNPLQGVDVLFNGNMSGTRTDMNGAYQINLSNKEGLLVFSVPGFKTREVEISERTIINIILTENLGQYRDKDIPGFYTPPGSGQMWDTWLYYLNGKYYMYYIGGWFGQWDRHDLAISDDGVNWKYEREIIKPRDSTNWMGTGHIWKSPDFQKDSTWMMNYSEYMKSKQDIMFAISKDLVNWTKVDENKRFKQDTRWYKAYGRWDCIDVMEGDDGYLYGYFTANPDPAKICYEFCNFGFARSKDGITWEALPPLRGNMSGELGGIQKLGDRYYITVSEGRIGIGESYKGPFIQQKKNPNMFGGDIYFPRFFHATPDGKPLVNHFYMNGVVYAAPLKDIEIDDEGILRLVWWKGNEKMKVNSFNSKLEKSNSAVKMWNTTFQKDKTYVIEGIIKLSGRNPDNDHRGIFFSNDNLDGSCIIFSRDKTTFGRGVITDESVEVEIQNVISRDLDLGEVQNFRVLLCNDMVEVYVNDYLTITKRVKYIGKIGIITGSDNKCFKRVRLWSS